MYGNFATNKIKLLGRKTSFFIEIYTSVFSWSCDLWLKKCKRCQANNFIGTFFHLFNILILIMLCMDFVLFLKGKILREFQNIEKFVIFWKGMIWKRPECKAIFPTLSSIETRRKRLDLMKNRISFSISKNRKCVR